MPSIDPKVRRAVWNLCLDGIKGDAKILEKLKGMGFTERALPSSRSIYRMRGDLEGRYPPEEQALDRPFQLTTDLPSPITANDVPLFLAIIRVANMGKIRISNAGITFRAMRWVATLRYSMAGDAAEWIWFMANLYAQRERWSRIEKEGFSTWDLDMLLAYGFWRSEANRNAYSVAVDCGLAPDVDEAVGLYVRDLSPRDANQASQLLEGWKESETLPEEIESNISAFSKRVAAIHDALPEERREAFMIFFYHLRNAEGANFEDGASLQKLQDFADLSASDNSSQQQSVLAEERNSK